MQSSPFTIDLSSVCPQCVNFALVRLTSCNCVCVCVWCVCVCVWCVSVLLSV